MTITQIRKLLPAQRHALIIHILAVEGWITVQEVSARLGVSQATARRDLNELAKSGRAMRTHGGAGRLQMQRTGSSWS
jgi:DeoR family ulaG and ulaABCDEF operon transcriptional repressor